jgi:DNA repair exonuclease SbcCD nuclease subunit
MIPGTIGRPAKVLHTSDCHLGAGPGGAEETAFALAMTLARDERVDAVLVAGDLFDSARVSDDVIAWAAGQLDSVACPVVVIPGNHDVLAERSVYHRFDLAAHCPRLHFIDREHGQLVAVPGTDVVVWGRAMTEHEPGYRPFAGLPPRPVDCWTIAIGHGLLLDDGPTDRSSPIFAADLAAVDWDYVALGHIHGYAEIRDEPTPVRYPGATAASRDGLAGLVLVDFVPGVVRAPLGRAGRETGETRERRVRMSSVTGVWPRVRPCRPTVPGQTERGH